MSKNNVLVPQASEALNSLKTEIATQLGVNLNGDAGNLTTRENGSVGGEMVKRMIAFSKGRQGH